MEYIAEIGWNFMGDLELAHKMILDAAEAGATTVKFQYWKPSKLRSGAWDNDGRREIYQKAQLNKDKILKLKDMCGSANIQFLISAFNAEDALELAELEIKSIKIPSHEITNKDLHLICIEKFETIYLSCGACTSNELNEIAEIYARRRSDQRLVAMHCISSYPCPPEKTNLPRFNKLKGLFASELGFSDHSTSTMIPALSVIYGCSVIEKHFTSDKSLPGRDNKFALVKDEFQKMVDACEEAALANLDLGIDYLDIEANTVNDYRGRWG
jgi:N,N'-diacetyllegionaminate synthase